MSQVPVKYQPSKEPSTNIVVDTGEKGWWSSLSPGQRNWIMWTAIITGVSVLAIIGFYFGQAQIRKHRYNIVESGSLGGDKYDTWAKQFHLAFLNDGWWGTDVPAVRRTMKAIASKEDFQKVQKSYEKLTKGGNLVADLSDELTTLEYEEMLAIVMAKPPKYEGSGTPVIFDPKGWAKRIHAAVNYSWIGFMPGTDLEAIKEVFSEMKTQTAFWAMAKAYHDQYHLHVWEELDGDLDYTWDWRAELHKKPKK